MIPTHGFMLADLRSTLIAACLFPLFVAAPGYALAWWFDLFEFRNRSWEFRAGLAVPLSISICPILVYLAGRFGTMHAVWGVFGFLWLACLAALVRGRARLDAADVFRRNRPILTMLALWVIVALFSLVDLQLGDRLYYSTTALDFSVRTEFIHSVSITGIPPANPFYYPGHATPIRYHYFWLLICSLTEQAAGSWAGPRQAWIAGAIWCGIGLIALVMLYLRVVWRREGDAFRHHAFIGVALLGVTGLDIIPNLGLWLMRAMGMQQAVKASVDWWNEQVAGFFSTALWEAHYLCSLICCLTAFLILWEAPAQRGFARRAGYGALAGLALASAVGAAIYVAFVFAVFLMLWGLVAIYKRWWAEIPGLVAAGVVAILLFLPYASELSGPASAGGPPLQFWVRPFSPIDVLFRQVLGGGWKIDLLNAAMLPLNYFLELGFFLAAAVVWWKARLRTGKSMTRAELAVGAMVATSVVICTFLRSSVIGNNDLGWRGFLIAQFGLLLWSVDVLAGGGLRKGLLVALLALGILGTTYDVLMLRFFPVMADAGFVATAGWMAPDRQFGKRTYAAREAWEWADSVLPRSARIQFNPHPVLQDTYAFLYARRQVVAADGSCLSGFGGDPSLCPPILAQLERFYPPNHNPAPASLRELCSSLPIDLLAVRDTDAVWSDRQSWVWAERPIFANRYYRLFGCGTTAAALRPSGL